MDANEATGPVYARHIGYRMYRGEAFAMQVDAHCVFVNGWDVGIIDQWKRTRNEMAVLSTYLTDVQGSVSPTGDSLRKTRPIMCNSDFEGSPSYLRHGAQPELVPAIRDVPNGRGIDYSGVAQDLDVMKVIDRRLYDPIISQLKRAVENNGRGANAALAEARRTKLTKHHPELAQLVEDVRRIH